MAAFECDLKRVLTDENDVFDAQLFRAERLHSREAPGRTRLTATFSAWTRPSQLLSGVGRAFAAFPRDVHRLARAIDVDVDWKRIGVLQWLGA
jgi:hypothetical protein